MDNHSSEEEWTPQGLRREMTSSKLSDADGQGNGVPKICNRSYKDPLRELHPSTAVIHAGYRSHMSERAIKAPVFRSSTFEFRDAEEGELFFKRAYGLEGSDGKPPGLVYSRLNNPNIEIFEDKCVAFEALATHASAFPSGMSAISTSVLSLVPQGGHVIYSSPVYGGSYFFLKYLCPERFGITSTGIDTSNLEALEQALKSSPRVDMLYIETPANPTLTLTDIEETAKLARAAHPDAIVLCDNTMMGPVFCQPFKWGADLVVYSATKFIGGHSDLIAGIVLTRSEEHISKINAFRTILGPVLSPETSWMLTRSLETLWMRMERQAQKAQQVVAALVNHPCVDKILFPGMYDDGSKSKAVYDKQCTGTGSMFSIIVKPPTRAAAYKVLNNLSVVHLAVSLGSSETLAQHPRSMTHSDMSVVDLDSCGISEGMIRFSVGLESSKDVAKDLLSALDLLIDFS